MDKRAGEIWIRNATAEDAEQLCAWWNDGKVMAHAGFPLGLNTTAEKIGQQLAADSDDTVRRHIILHHARPIGEMVYRNLGERVCEIGIKICEADEQNRGLGKKILTLFIEGLFEDLGYEKIVLDTNLNNRRAQHVYERLGFQKQCVHVDKWQDQLGAWQSSVDYALTRETFAPVTDAIT